jgi:lysyl endopeptidase
VIREVGTCLLLFMAVFELNAQTFDSVLPWSYTEKLSGIEAFVAMETFDAPLFLASCQASSDINSKGLTFAKPISVHLNPLNSGCWHQTAQGQVWQLGIKSRGAYSIYLSCGIFALHKGVAMYVYAPGYGCLTGPFVSRDGHDASKSFPAVLGDEIIVELNVPWAAAEYGKLLVSKVYHDCVNVFAEDSDSHLKSLGGTCTEDINGPNGKYWQTDKRAVCKIVSDGQLSTGTLVGNTTRSKEAYVLTANHTLFDSLHAAQAIFYFNDETFTFNQSPIIGSQFVLGGSLVATSAKKLDFSLVKLNEIPPPSFRPYYAGWDARGNASPGGVCIHHPWGQAKQIAIDYQGASMDSYGANYDQLSFWHVSHWEVGTTQNGSSGAPLFNSQHQLVGTLTGGRATCNNPVDDYFSQFSLAWDKYPGKSNCLESWLDPECKGIGQIDGYDPYGFDPVNCDTIWNFPNSDKLQVSKGQFDWGYISGHNSDMFTQFAEKFYLKGHLQLPGVYLFVAKAKASHPLSSLLIKVWEGDEEPRSLKYSKVLKFKDVVADAVNFVGFDSIVNVSGDFFVGYELDYGLSQDTFCLYHTIKPTKEPSSMYVYNGSWKNVDAVASAGFSASLAVGLVECYGKVSQLPSAELKVYPNPCNDRLTLQVPSEAIVNNVVCFDVGGRTMPINIAYEDDQILVRFNLPAGIYMLKLNTSNGELFAKFIVTHTP